MKNLKLFGIIILIAVMTFALLTCSNGTTDSGGGGPRGPQSVTYSGYVDSKTYTLTITENTQYRAAYNPKAEDLYSLVISDADEMKESTGYVIDVEGRSIQLQPSVSGAPSFMVYTIGESGIAGIPDTDTITFSGGQSDNGPGEIIPNVSGVTILERFTSVFDGYDEKDIEDGYEFDDFEEDLANLKKGGELILELSINTNVLANKVSRAAGAGWGGYSYSLWLTRPNGDRVPYVGNVIAYDGENLIIDKGDGKLIYIEVSRAGISSFRGEWKNGKGESFKVKGKLFPPKDDEEDDDPYFGEFLIEEKYRGTFVLY